MNELKEHIDNQDFTLKLYNICSDLFRNDQIPDVGVEVIKDLIVNDLMQLIETYTAKKELESYKKGIIAGWEESAEGYNYEYSGFPAVSTEEIVTQLSSQLTNNKDI